MTATLHVVFDGRCGFCTRAVGWVRALDRHGRIELHAWQVPGVLERFGLTPEQGDSSVWAVRSEPDERTGPDERAGRAERASGHRISGQHTSGAHAVAVVLDTALGVRVFERFYRLPLVGRVQERVYRWVAEHRGRFPGVTPWCEQHPGRCATP